MELIACLRAFIRDEAGQDLTEYGFLAFLIAVVAILSVTSFGTNLDRLWTSISNSLSTVA